MSGSAPAARPADGSFTPSELAQYRAFGYCVVRQLLTQDETARIGAEHEVLPTPHSVRTTRAPP